MAKDPAVLLYTSDFISGVSDLTMEERGQYITLLCLQHQKGRLTKKTIDISCPNLSEDVLSKFTKDKNGNFYNKRLEKEAEKRREHSKKQRQRALDGWKKRKATADAAALPLEDENEDVNNNIKDNRFFSEFWNLYNKKVGESMCKTAWGKLESDTKSIILEKLPKYIESTPNKKYRKNPYTYLTEEAWKDDVEVEEKKVYGSKEKLKQELEYVKRLKEGLE